MLRSARALTGFIVHAADGEVGRVDALYLDDAAWIVRYLVVRHGGRRVLLSPVHLQRARWDGGAFLTSLTREQFRDLPDVDRHPPVSRQRIYDVRMPAEPAVVGGGLGGVALRPVEGAAPEARLGAALPEPAGPQAVRVARAPEEPDAPQVLSTNAVLGQRVRARDGEVGRIEDVLIDDETWAVRYLVVGGAPLAPAWLARWDASGITVDAARDAITSAPALPELPDRAYETRLHEHYGRPPYWEAPGNGERR